MQKHSQHFFSENNIFFINRQLPLLMVFLTMITVCSCSRNSATGAQIGNADLMNVEISKEYSPWKINTVAIYPFEAVIGKQFLEEDLQSASATLVDVFDTKTSFDIVNKSHLNVSKVDKMADSAEGQTTSLRNQAINFAQELGSQAVVYGLLTEYRERSGSSFGSNTSAKIGFRLWLVEVATGKILWKIAYKNSDKSLSEDIYRAKYVFSEGLGFKTVQELLKNGLIASAKAIELEKDEHK